MKKSPKDQHERLEKLRIKRTEHQQVRKKHSYQPDRIYQIAPKVLGARELQAPKKLQLNNHEYHSETVKFIQNIWRYTKADRVRLKFDECIFITVPALLLLYANIQIIRDLDEHKTIRLSLKNCPHKTKSLLTISGITEMVMRKESSDNIKTAHQAPIIYGTESRHDDILDHIQNTIYKGKITPEEENRLGDALSEVFLNVVDHAYPDEKFPQLDHGPWWAMWSVIDNQLWLAVFDTGVGIPSTIKEDHWLTKTVKGITPDKLHILVNDDAAKIELAMKEGQNRRDEPKHGQGSASMHALVEKNPDGQLWVYSNKGRYNWTRDKNGEPTHQKATHEFSINGTIIQWNISINHGEKS